MATFVGEFHKAWGLCFLQQRHRIVQEGDERVDINTAVKKVVMQRINLPRKSQHLLSHYISCIIHTIHEGNGSFGIDDCAVSGLLGDLAMLCPRTLREDRMQNCFGVTQECTVADTILNRLCSEQKTPKTQDDVNLSIHLVSIAAKRGIEGERLRERERETASVRVRVLHSFLVTFQTGHRTSQLLAEAPNLCELTTYQSKMPQQALAGV